LRHHSSYWFTHEWARLKTQNDVELRRLLVDDYELQYEVLPEGVRIARVFHMREDR
jgi:hypothetical protein